MGTKILFSVGVALATLALCASYDPTTKKGHVLFYFPVMPESAKITFMPVAEELAARGHEVTVVNPYKSKSKPVENLREILFEAGNLNLIVKDFDDKAWSAEFQKIDMSYFSRLFEFFKAYIRIAGEALEFREIRDIFEGKTSKIDAIVTMPVTGNEIAFYLGYKLNATVVIWSPQQNPMSIFDNAIGQPHNTAHIGNFFSTYRHPMTFKERVLNTLGVFLMNHLRDWNTLDQLEEVLDRQFPEDKNRPGLRELEKKTGLFLQFSHPLIMDGIRPTNPNYVSVGMMNCRPPKALPESLEKVMNESGDDGVILVSFGSVLNGSKMPENLRVVLLKVFGRLKQKVLWKWETEEMEGKPDNLVLSKWLPQQDILGHPKLKLFVSHGGQSSCQESLCHQKPMVIIPVFGDQPANAKESEIKGFGIHVPLHNITEESFYKSVMTVLNDPKFSRRAKEHGSLLMDDITKPLDRAIWWLEYSMRYPGMKHLRSPVLDMPWYQHSLLDVYAFFAAFIFLILFGFKIAFSCCIKIVCGRKQKRD